MAAAALLGVLLGLAVGGFIVAVFLRASAHWVARLDIPFGTAFGLGLGISFLNGFMSFIVGLALSSTNLPVWIPPALSYLVNIAIGGAVLAGVLQLRFARATRIYLVSTLLALGILGTVGAAVAFTL